MSALNPNPTEHKQVNGKSNKNSVLNTVVSNPSTMTVTKL